MPKEKQQTIPGLGDLFESEAQQAEYLCTKCGDWFTAEAGLRLYFCDDCQPDQLGLFGAPEHLTDH